MTKRPFVEEGRQAFRGTMTVVFLELKVIILDFGGVGKYSLHIVKV